MTLACWGCYKRNYCISWSIEFSAPRAPLHCPHNGVWPASFAPCCCLLHSHSNGYLAFYDCSPQSSGLCPVLFLAFILPFLLVHKDSFVHSPWAFETNSIYIERVFPVKIWHNQVSLPRVYPVVCGLYCLQPSLFAMGTIKDDLT